jgi:cob(I)alamin adenosyltransferase
MPYRLTKIYTRTGDDGFTNLGDKRLSKDDLLVEALGNVDELNSCLGFVHSLGSSNKALQDALSQIQHELFDLGGELHLPKRIVISAEKVTRLEETLDTWNKTLPPLQEFLLPRGNPASAACHIARTVCRRAERSLVRLHRQTPLDNPLMLRYLNRLSDLLFVAARLLARESGEHDILWDNKKEERRP